MDIMKHLMQRYAASPGPCTLCAREFGHEGIFGALMHAPDGAMLQEIVRPGRWRLLMWRTCLPCADKYDGPDDLAEACRERLLEAAPVTLH